MFTCGDFGLLLSDPCSQSPQTTQIEKKSADPSTTKVANETKTDPPAQNSVVDEELEKRKARAARFGIPLVETNKSRQTQGKRSSLDQRPTDITPSADVRDA